MSDLKKIEIVYDGQCPVCTLYCTNLKFDDRTDMHLIDARQKSDLMTEITAQGLDIDEGMVVRAEGEIYYGSAAMNFLAQTQGQSGWTGLLNRYFFKTKRAAGIFYPLGKFIRNRLLDILGIARIKNLEKR